MDDLKTLIELAGGLSTPAMLFLLLVLWWRFSSRTSTDDNKVLQGMMALFGNAMTEISAAVKTVAENTDTLRKLLEDMARRTDSLELAVGNLPDLLAQHDARIAELLLAERARVDEVNQRDLALLDLINKMSDTVANMEKAIRLLQDSHSELAEKMTAEHERLSEALQEWLATILAERFGDSADDTA